MLSPHLGCQAKTDICSHVNSSLHAFQAPNIAYMELPLAELMERSLKLSSLITANQVCL